MRDSVSCVVSLIVNSLYLMPSIAVGMMELPDELLDLIAKQVVGKEGGLRLWCKLSSTCRRLRIFELPPNPAYLLDESLTNNGDCFS